MSRTIWTGRYIDGLHVQSHSKDVRFVGPVPTMGKAGATLCRPAAILARGLIRQRYTDDECIGGSFSL